MRIVTLLLLSGALIAATGCVSKSRHQREVGNLQGQVAQLEASLREQQAKSQAKPELAGEEIAFQGSMYRTPSGFELPALDIQKALKSAGYYAGAIDGKMGPSSREAVRDFQRDNGLTADGVCGRQTWLKLKPYLEAK